MECRLCRLINNSLSSFSEPLNKDKERELLLRLSQISKTIRALEDEDEDATDSDHVIHPSLPHAAHSQDCFANILSHLVVFLGVDSQHVRHSTSNVLVGISKFVSTTVGDWDRYLYSLCIYLEVSISNILSSTPVSLTAGINEQDSRPRKFILYVQAKVVDANWYTVAGLVRVLRTILKYLKEFPDGELREIYTKHVSSCLTDIPWDLMNGMHVCKDSESQISSSIDLSGKKGYRVSRFVFLGALLQLCCSLVHQSSRVEDAMSNDQSLIGKIASLVPKLLHWCFDKHEDDDWTSSLEYLRHKICS